MKYVLCPRCELNYMPEGEKLCSMCQRESKGAHRAEETELCSVCNEYPVVPGYDMCAACLREMGSRRLRTSEDMDSDSTLDVNLGDMDAVSQMDDILPDDQTEDKEYAALDQALSMEEDADGDEDEDAGDEDEA